MTNKINNKMYIGRTITALKIRTRNHVYTALNELDHCVALESAIRKYGIKNFNVEVIDSAKTIEELIHLESFYIKSFNTLAPNSYNLVAEDTNTRIYSEESIERMSKSHQGRSYAYPDKKSSKFKGVIIVNKDTVICRITFHSKVYMHRFKGENAEIKAATLFDKGVLYLYKTTDVKLNFPQDIVKYQEMDLKEVFQKHFLSKNINFYHSKFHGVAIVKNTNRWRVKGISGSFLSEKIAAKVADFINIKRNKEHKLNFPDLLSWYKTQNIDKFVAENRYKPVKTLSIWE